MALRQQKEDLNGPPWQCKCGCGCRNDSYNPTGSYCRRCDVGDCPHPDEQIPETCPQCRKQSDKATIDEFGYCLRSSCSRPR